MKTSEPEDGLVVNDQIVGSTRAMLRRRGIKTISLVGPPRSGKTALLERTGSRLASHAQVGVLVGNPAAGQKSTRLGRLGICALPLPGGAKPVSLLQTQFAEGVARVSPDGHWLAYTSSESGTFENYVRPFTPDAPAGTGAKFMVSKGGGALPLWRPDGKELFYLSLTNQVMAVDIDTSKGFQAGTPRRMFASPVVAAPTVRWDVSPDGKRFLFAAPPSATHVIPFTVVLNWAAGLKK